MRAARRWFPICLLLAVVGCQAGPETTAGGGRGAAEGRAATAVEAPEAAAVRIVFLGDSLTAGFGLAEAEAFPALVEERLRARGLPVRVVNAGVSGDTSAGGLSRLDWLLRQQPEILFVCLGANDGLRGLSPEMTERNLREIVERGRAAGARVVLAGMRLPPNYGPDYVERFEELYPRLARELEVEWVPFLLEGVAGRRSLNLPDRIHPNAAGHRQIADTVLPALLPLVETLAAG